ncbi:MAG TPA: homocysteine S-methyltransferase family protein [Verrucomicrobiae bacterium]|nr:homocysteine S-methyltransferase family protein [Verrucomicrobiae bacterium]
MDDDAPVARGRGLRHRGRVGAGAEGEAATATEHPPAGPIVAPPSPEPGPENARWRALLAEGGPILADGAMGTMLFAAGLQFGDPPEAWNVSNSEVVRRIHRGYLNAGSRIVMTNTFGGNRLRLRLHGLDTRVSELNRTAAVMLRAEVDAAGGDALVAGDIGPTGEIMAPLGTLDEAEAVDVFAQQAAALIAGGVDLIWIETMSHLSEIGAAIRGARQASAGIPIIATMTFDTRGYTMMGVSPEQAARCLIEAGADAIGGNCGNGPDELLPVIAQMQAVAPDAILVAKSNAGMPELIDMRAVYRADPPTMAEAALGFRAAGARIIGACCGSSPTHLAAMAEALGVAR